MGQVRHGSATTAHAVRAAIQQSQASFAALSRKLGINPKTVAEWRKRATVEVRKTGPKAPHKTLTEAEKAAVIAFRRHTLLPLDDCLYALQPSIPHLTRVDRRPSRDPTHSFKQSMENIPFSVGLRGFGARLS